MAIPAKGLGKAGAMSDLEHAVASFRARVDELSPAEVVQRYITGGVCARVTDEAVGDLGQRVSAQFGVHPTNVFIVGSAKLGFSIAPRKRFKAFSDESDVDVAIVSTDLYVRIWRQIADLVNEDRTFDWPRRPLLERKHLSGWLRPDALPPSAALPLADEWFEFFRDLTADEVCGPYGINAGLYYDIHFLESYQQIAVSQCATTGGIA
jgi:hypothetical protein